MPTKKRTAKQLPAKPTPEPEPELLDPAVPDEVIDEVYSQIRDLQRGATVDLGIQVGGLMVERFFGGDLSRARSPGASTTSLRKLAQRFDEDGTPGLSHSGLHRMIGLYGLEREVGVSTLKQLGVSHLYAVLGLPVEKQRELLTKANEEGWTVKRLEDKASAVRKKEGDGRGRPRLPAIVKTVNLLASLAGKEESFGDLDGLEKVADDRVQGVRDGLAKLRARLGEIEKALAKRLRAAARST